MTYLVDTHCHLSGLSLSGEAGSSVKEILKRANRAGVTHFLCVSCTTKEFANDLKLASEFNGVYFANGVHPLNLEEERDWTDEQLIKNLTSDDRVIALGETGLDFHYAPETKDIQIPSFVRQINIAREVKKPLVIHARDARAVTVDILQQENARDIGGVIHCFTDTIEMARACLDMGFYISFTGISTFKASDNVREIIKYVPDDRIMLETDCPYLAPIPVRGIENEPAFVRYTLKFIADFKGTSEEHLAKLTSDNFERLYGIKLTEPAFIDSDCSDYKLEKIIDKPFEK
ncbi:MAG: TatD family hydrolase [Succinivibrio sp.]